MGWSEDRVEILTKLWMQGLSASQIAVELGGGVTRNAVIGKVHRLKLSGRVKPATSTARARNANKSTRRASTSKSSTSSTNATTKRRNVGYAPVSIGATALKSEQDQESELLIGHAQEQEVNIPISERMSLLELSEDNCKWPNGDPLRPDFHFCGRRSLDGKPYCEAHSQRAYHKPDRKKR